MSTAKKDAALTVLTVACGYDDSLRAWVAQRIRAYAARHDYTAQVFLRAWDERCDSSSWEKLNRTRAALRGGAPYVLTVDADAVILPTAGSLRDQCAALDAAGKTWAMSDDENGPNGGVVLYKNDARTLAMLDEMAAQEQALRSAWLAPFHWEQRAFMYAIGSSHWALKNRLQGWLSLPSSPNSAAHAATKGALDPQWYTRLDDASPRRSIVHLAGGPRAKATKPAMMRALLRLGATNAGVPRAPLPPPGTVATASASDPAAALFQVVHRFTPGTVATRGIVAEARGAWAGQGFRLDEVSEIEPR